jgi:hypothetical protein
VFGLHALTAFLDFKARSTSEEITVEYYGAGNYSVSDTDIVANEDQLPEQPASSRFVAAADIENPYLEIQA